MKKGIHPTLHNTPVTCSCGNTFHLQTVLTEMRVEKCSQCHPFYTGVQKFGSADGRIDRFNRKFNRN